MDIKTQKFFKILFIVTALISLWLGGRFFYDLFSYFSLSKQTIAHILEWKVIETKGEKFNLFARYEYTVGNKTYQEEHFFSKPLYPNKHLAQDDLKKWAAFQWNVWYQPKAPTQSSLQRFFPFKKGIHFLLGSFILIYFVCFNEYIKRMHDLTHS